MASTYSTDLRLELIGNGDQTGTWGTTTNTNLGTLLEESIVGSASVPITDGVATVITISDGASSTARKVFLTLTGTLTAGRVLEVPAKRKNFIVHNNTSGGFAVTVKVTGQTGISVPNGAKRFLYCDGTDVRDAINDLPSGTTLDGSGLVTAVSTTTFTNKTLTDPVINVRDGSFSIQDNADATKQLRFEVSGITTSTIRTLTVPNFNGTIATLAGTETFTNKTITGPSISAPTISGAIALTGNATFSNVIILPVGALAGTSLQFASDPNTGIYSPGADQVSLVTGGTARLNVAADGSITVTGNLTVNGTASFGGAGAGVTTDGTQTLTNKTLTDPIINVRDNVFSIQDNADATKQLRFETSGISTSTIRTLTAPNFDGTIATLAGTETFTNKTLTSPTINTPTLTVNDNSLSIRDNADVTKLLAFELSGISTGTTRTLTIPNASGTLALTSWTLTAGTGLTGGGDLSANRTVTLVAFTGDSGSGGTLGGVPAPSAGDAAASKVLGAGGGWVTAGLAAASAAQINAMSSTTTAISPGNLATALAETTLVPSTNTITPDLTAFVNGIYTLTTGQALTLANPSASVIGKQHRIRLTQPSSGSVGTITFGTSYKKAAADSALLTASLSAIDYIYLDVRASNEILYSFKRQVA